MIGVASRCALHEKAKCAQEQIENDRPHNGGKDRGRICKEHRFVAIYPAQSVDDRHQRRRQKCVERESQQENRKHGKQNEQDRRQKGLP